MLLIFGTLFGKKLAKPKFFKLHLHYEEQHYLVIC